MYFYFLLRFTMCVAIHVSTVRHQWSRRGQMVAEDGSDGEKG